MPLAAAGKYELVEAMALAKSTRAMLNLSTVFSRKSEAFGDDGRKWRRECAGAEVVDSDRRGRVTTKSYPARAGFPASILHKKRSNWTDCLHFVFIALKMSTSELVLATRANGAALLPALLIATSVNEARPSPLVTVTYEDAAVLPDGDNAVVKFTGPSGNPVYGTDNAIKELRTAFPFLKGKNEKLVWLAFDTHTCMAFSNNNFRRIPGFLRWRT